MRIHYVAGLLAVIGSHAMALAAELQFAKDAVTLDAIERGRTVARWYTQIETSEGPLRFGELIVGDEDGDVDERRATVALVGRVRGVSDAALRIESDDSRPLGWQYVAVGPAEGEVWGVLDSLYTEPNPSLTIVRSPDGGATWTVQQLQKPAPQAEFASLTMTADGQGQITLYLPQGQGGLQPGFYAFTTTDTGKTWTAGKRQGDEERLSGIASGDLRSPLVPRRVRAEYYGGSGWLHRYRPICRPYGWVPTRPPGGWEDETIVPSVHDKGRLKALENPGFDDRMEKGKVPARFDISPKPDRDSNHLFR